MCYTYPLSPLMITALLSLMALSLLFIQGKLKIGGRVQCYQLWRNFCSIKLITKKSCLIGGRPINTYLTHLHTAAEHRKLERMEKSDFLVSTVDFISCRHKLMQH